MAEKRGTRAIVVVAVSAALAGGLIYLATRKVEAVPPEEPLPGLATLYGVVTDVATGKALSGVTVSLWSPDMTELLLYTTTNGAGSYSLANILPGSYVLYFEKEGYETLTR